MDSKELRRSAKEQVKNAQERKVGKRWIVTFKDGTTSEIWAETNKDATHYAKIHFEQSTLKSIIPS
jgi:hypothetical protein